MSDEHLSDGQRKDLYVSLLRGIANECQDRLCAADQQHAWGPWENYIVQPENPRGIRPVDFSAAPSAHDECYRVASRRKCLNCGKEAFSG